MTTGLLCHIPNPFDCILRWNLFKLPRLASAPESLVLQACSRHVILPGKDPSFLLRLEIFKLFFLFSLFILKIKLIQIVKIRLKDYSERPNIDLQQLVFVYFLLYYILWNTNFMAFSPVSSSQVFISLIRDQNAHFVQLIAVKGLERKNL